MMRRTCACLLVFLLLATHAAATGAPQGYFVVQDGITYHVTDHSAKIISIDAARRHVVIEPTVADRRVFITSQPFLSAAAMETLTIETGEHSLNSLCLKGLTKLKSIDIYGETDFTSDDLGNPTLLLLDCPVLESFTLHGVEGEAPPVMRVENMTVLRCPALSSITIGEGYVSADIGIDKGSPTVTLPGSVESAYIRVTAGVPTFDIHPDNAALTVVAGNLYNLKTGELAGLAVDEAITHLDIPDTITSATIDSPYLQSLRLPATMEELLIIDADALDTIAVDGQAAPITPGYFEIPQGMTYLRMGAPLITHIDIPETLEAISVYGNRLETIACSERNERLRVIDNVLFSKDGAKLLLYPAGDTRTAYTIAAGVADISMESSHLEHLAFTDATEERAWVYIVSDSLQTIAPAPDQSLECLINGSSWFNWTLHTPSLQEIVATGGDDGLRVIDGCIYGDTVLFIPAGVESLHVPEGIESIYQEGYAYVGGEGLREMVLPASMALFDPGIYYMADSENMDQPPRLSPGTYRVAEDNPHFMVRDGFLLSKDGKRLIAAPADLPAYLELPAGIEEIGSYAFPAGDTLETLIIPEGVTSIGFCAFASQAALRNVSLPSTLLEIESGAFEDCFRLEKVVLPSGMTVLNDIFRASDLSAYNWETYWPERNIQKLEVVIPAGITEIEESWYGKRLPDELYYVVEKGSAAHLFALRQGIPYRCIDDPLDTSDVAFGTQLSSGKTVRMLRGLALDSDGNIVSSDGVQRSSNAMYLGGLVLYGMKATPVYAQPSRDAQVLRDISKGRYINPVSTAGAWLRVITREEMIGYVDMASADLYKSMDASSWPIREAVLAVVIGGMAAADVYEQPAASAAVIAKCRPGELFRVDIVTEDYCRVYLSEDGMFGYIATELLNVVK